MLALENIQVLKNILNPLIKKEKKDKRNTIIDSNMS